MLTKENFTIEHIERVRESRKVDKTILERSIYALGLLEALVTVGMKFIFKGGTSLTLLLDSPKRLSTDIDIIVSPGTDVKEYIEEASRIFPFKSYTEQIRTGRDKIEKRHLLIIHLLSQTNPHRLLQCRRSTVFLETSLLHLLLIRQAFLLI